MSNLQSKLGDGLSMIQGSVEQGKSKLQTTQEVAKLKKIMKESAEEKSKMLLQLGLHSHQLVRTSHLEDETLVSISTDVKKLDKVIYEISQKISELTATNNDVRNCECGAVITDADKFCGECGAKVNQVNEVNVEESQCSVCAIPMPTTAEFCGCCGTAMTTS